MSSAPVVYSISWGDPLPIKLLSFDGVYNNGHVDLTWKTGKEVNNKGFYVQRSTNSIDWEDLEFVSSLGEDGNSSELLLYTTKDEQPAYGINLYRLKQVDFDVKFEYSGIVKIQVSKEQLYAIYPNPATSEVTVSGLNKGTEVQLFNMSGKMVFSTEADKSKLSLNISTYTSGTYVIVIIDAIGQQSYKLVIE